MSRLPHAVRLLRVILVTALVPVLAPLLLLQALLALALTERHGGKWIGMSNPAVCRVTETKSLIQ